MKKNKLIFSVDASAIVKQFLNIETKIMEAMILVIEDDSNDLFSELNAMLNVNNITLGSDEDD